ncbi:hypothetical protein SDRG_11913 [Saprolegnia diclina VS20]|uniref:Uncharacterized protein n=1 Tax=Saprolegnia diclina (strain VS20) TaxID=1156394 RepID=T0Q6V7_SAPDV|nr:hypothetical protein SDRG_11913 [Saprolegnia diclina VS20]EQC30336.1 hypothetical protein SDRG_11913 [Saprolegnia diclina VS20]|eukprot:XP_008616189.1 hypothetical protein SDRG_11913 [Saprolegnia diclina VS20]
MSGHQKLCATRCPLPPAADERVHVLPCKVKYDGKAPISSYFVVEDAGDAKAARFRGIELSGTEVHLDALGYAGLVMVDEGVPDETAEDDFNAFSSDAPSAPSSIWEIEGHFATLVDWQTKDLPSHDAIVKRLAHWNSISAAIHDD